MSVRVGRLEPGTYEVGRARRARFPIHRVVGRDGPVADLGRYSALWIYFGPGQRARLADGREWRVTATRYGGGLSTLIVDEARRRVAQAFPGIGNYHLDVVDGGYVLNPAEGGRGRANRWLIDDGDAVLATVSRRPHRLVVDREIPLGVGLLALLLALTGIPGEGDLGVPAQYA